MTVMHTPSGLAIVVYFICAACFAAHVEANGPQTVPPHGLVIIETYDPFLSVADKERGIGSRSKWLLSFADGGLRFYTDGATQRPSPDAPGFPSIEGREAGELLAHIIQHPV